MTQEQLEAAKEARRAYDRAWYAKNKAKVRQRKLEHWAKKAKQDSNSHRECVEQAQKELLSRLQTLPLPKEEIKSLLRLAMQAFEMFPADNCGQSRTL